MRRDPLRGAAAVGSFVALLAATAAGQNVLRVHDGRFNSDGSTAEFATAFDFVGDVDADGVDDYAISAPLAEPGGETYVYSGRTGALLHTLVAEGVAHEFGRDVAPAGDIDGDGHADFYVVAPQWPTNHDLFDDGRVYLYSGATGAVIRTIDGTDDENLFRARPIGDVDGDSVPDVVVVARVSGVARAYSGQSGAYLWSLTHSGFETFSGPVAALDDVDGDGIPDLCAAANNFIFPAYVGVYSGADGTEIRRFTMAIRGGVDVTSLPDLDSDGARELAIGIPTDPSGTGVVEIYSGASGTKLLTLAGALSGDQFGFHVADAGDFNGDGVSELAVQSAPWSAPRTKTRVQLFRLDTQSLIASFPSEWSLGNDLAGARDLDGDGRAELLVADRGDTDFSTRHGRAWVFRGDDLALFANEVWFAEGDALVLDQRQGWSDQPASVWLLDVNGSPFVLRLAGGTYDGVGSFSLSATVPPGLAGIDLGVIAFGIDLGGKLRRSAVTRVEFR